MDGTQDRSLVADVLSGDTEAFSRLVRKYQHFAYGVAVGVLPDFDLAQDAVQEAFLAAYRDLHRLSDSERFAGWLRGIVRNCALRILRDRRQVLQWVEEFCEGTEPMLDAPSMDQVLVESERRDLVRQALERLDSKNREAVSLYYVDGLSYADIADLIGVTQATVKGRIQRGRAQMRGGLEMAKDVFGEERPSDDFSTEIARIIDSWADRGTVLTQEISRLVEIGAPAVDALCSALDDPRRSVHRSAARALCAIGDPHALERLFAAARAWRVPPRCGVLSIPGAREALLRVVREGAWDDVAPAIRLLGQAHGDEEAYEAILSAFRRPGPWRIEALWRLTEMRPESAAAVIAEAVASGDTGLHSQAMLVSGERGVLPPMEACLSVLSSSSTGSWYARAMAADCVRLHGEEGERILRQLLRTGSPDERATAAMGLASGGDGEVFEVLLHEITRETRETRDRKWRRHVTAILGTHFAPQLADWIASHPDRRADLGSALWALVRRKEAESVRIAETLLHTGTPSARVAAMRLLCRERGTGMLEELRQALSEGHPSKVAREAFDQMYKLGGDAGLPTVEVMLRSERWTERRAAVALLKRWGRLGIRSPKRITTEVPPEIRRLESEALHDTSIAVRQAGPRQP